MNKNTFWLVKVTHEVGQDHGGSPITNMVRVVVCAETLNDAVDRVRDHFEKTNHPEAKSLEARHIADMALDCLSNIDQN